MAPPPAFSILEKKLQELQQQLPALVFMSSLGGVADDIKSKLGFLKNLHAAEKESAADDFADRLTAVEETYIRWAEHGVVPSDFGDIIGDPPACSSSSTFSEKEGKVLEEEVQGDAEGRGGGGGEAEEGSNSFVDDHCDKPPESCSCTESYLFDEEGGGDAELPETEEVGEEEVGDDDDGEGEEEDGIPLEEGLREDIRRVSKVCGCGCSKRLRRRGIGRCVVVGTGIVAVACAVLCLATEFWMETQQHYYCVPT